jgi:excisionase family DNA binding protein
MNTPQLALYLSVTESCIRAWVKTRKIPFHKAGRLVRFSRKEIEAWMQGNAVAPIVAGVFSK